MSGGNVSGPGTVCWTHAQIYISERPSLDSFVVSRSSLKGIVGFPDWDYLYKSELPKFSMMQGWHRYVHWPKILPRPSIETATSRTTSVKKHPLIRVITGEDRWDISGFRKDECFNIGLFYVGTIVVIICSCIGSRGRSEGMKGNLKQNLFNMLMWVQG